MIVKTDALKTDDGTWATINHVFNKPEDNEIINVIQGSQQRVRDDYASAIQARSRHGVIHVKLSPEEHKDMTGDDWQHCLDVISAEFDCDPAAATVVEHYKKGRTHRHIYIPAYDPIAGKKRSLSWSKFRSVAVAKVLERDLNHPHTPIPDYLNERVCKILSERGQVDLVKELEKVPEGGVGHKQRDGEQAKRHGLDIEEVKASLKFALENNHDRASLETALKNIGWRIELLDSESGKRKRWAFVFIADPKWTLPTTRGTGLRKRDIDKIMKDMSHGIKRDVLERQVKEAAIEAIEAETKASTPESVSSRGQRAAETGRPESDRNQTVSSYQGATRPAAGRPANGNGVITLRTDAAPGAGRRSVPTGADTRRVGSDARGTKPNCGTAKRTAKTARPVITYQKTHSELIKRLKRPITPAEYVLATRDNNLGRSRGDLYLERPEIIATGWNGEHHPYSHASDHEQRGYYEARLLAKWGALESVEFKDGAYHVTTKKGDMFADYGDRITSPQPGQIKRQTANEIVRAAKARGWTSLDVNGSPSYKDEITIAAAMQGITTNHELTPEGQEQLAKQIEWRKQHGYKMDNVIYINDYKNNVSGMTR